MATLVMDCPHCGTKRASMVTFGATVYPASRGDNGRWPIALAASCSTCSEPIISRAWPTAQHSSQAGVQQSINALAGNFTDIGRSGFEVETVWPRPAEPLIPASIPGDIERAMLQAERNYPTLGNEEAAAVMYRRSLELALKDKAPDLKGVLAARIKKMVASHDLTPAIGEWADEIRSLGNEAAHDDGDVDRAELTMIRGFTDAVLRYLYTLPAEVAARRKLPGNAVNDEI